MTQAGILILALRMFIVLELAVGTKEGFPGGLDEPFSWEQRLQLVGQTKRIL